jgi:3',5'-cyclic-AMP phosphodiesterase
MTEARHPLTVVQPDTDTVRIVQLTDTHLCQQPGGVLLGMDTDHSLRAVIDLVQAERSGIDLLLGTGDLSDKGTLEAYERLEDYCSQFTAPCFWLPGNHDDRDQMVAAGRSPDRLSPEIQVGNWQVLMLDSQVPGEVGGRLGDGELNRLQEALERARDQSLFTLVCLHHQPVKIGCTWLDEQMVADADAFWRILDRFAGVRAVLWGHVHQEFEQQRGEVTLLASPSTCVQFAPGSVDFKADDEPPGYRWLDLHRDGRIDSGISRVLDVTFHVDLDSAGYLEH